MNRQTLLDQLAQPRVYDLVVVGGGATGLGVALDAATRGFVVALVESHDFAGGTSSRATKLLHGGVRYLAQGRFSLVYEALHERRVLLANAPHLVQPLPFVIPIYRWWQLVFYGLGLKLYDWLAGKASLGATRWLSRAQTLQSLLTLQPRGLKGGLEYWDAQFDDARLALALARTAKQLGACVVNYCAATGLLHEGGRVVGVQAQDMETGRRFELRARCVVNATGVWVDALRAQDGQGDAMVAPSQGAHLVVDRAFWPANQALLVPRTSDGRVLFVLPWLGKVILGTTDTPRGDLPREPLVFEEEIAFVLREVAPYLERAPQRADVSSVWAGLRPLVKPVQNAGQHTRSLSREHTIVVSPSGLVSVTGGKWTTYRVMAQEVLNKCVAAGLLPRRGGRGTARLKLWGAQAGGGVLGDACDLHSYGSQAAAVLELPGAERELGGGLTEAMVRFAARYEYARTVEDVLARRCRLLFLDAKLAQTLAPQVAALLWGENGVDPRLAAFLAVAKQYQIAPD